MFVLLLAALLVPILLFFFHRYVQLNRVQTNHFKLSAAIRAFDNVAFVGVFIHLDNRFAFGARSSWHCRFFPPVFSAPEWLARAKKFLNQNLMNLQACRI